MKDFKISYQERSHILTFDILHEQNSDDIFQYFQVSRKSRYRYYCQKCVTVNHQIITQNTLLPPHSRLQIAPLPDDIPSITPCFKEITVCYEDELCLIVSKPPKMLVHSDGVHCADTLHNCIQAYYDAHQIRTPIRSIHRLDYETSGLVFYCKMPFFQGYFDEQLKQKKIERIYLAWVLGQITAPLTITKAIGRDRHDAKKMRVSKTGMSAHTEVIPLLLRDNTTLVKCLLKTGRTHQIRVHLADAHHPILSDPLYGSPNKQIKRCALHAWQLRFMHPLYEKMITVCDMPPEDMHINPTVLSDL